MREGDLFYIIGNERRRYLIDAIADARKRDDSLDIGSATDAVGRMIHGPGFDESFRNGEDNNTRLSIYSSLHQTHIPRMHNAGIIIRDPKTLRIEPGPRFGDAHAMLVVARDARDGVERRRGGTAIPSGDGVREWLDRVLGKGEARVGDTPGDDPRGAVPDE